MGGSGVGGNVTAAAEFNVHHDPEAAAEVLGAPVPVRMYGLEVFEHVRLRRADVDGLAASAHPALRLAGGCAPRPPPAAAPWTPASGTPGPWPPWSAPTSSATSAARWPSSPATARRAGPRSSTAARRAGRLRHGHPVEVHEGVDGPALAAALAGDAA